MANIDEAMRATKALARQFKPLMQVGEFIEGIASMEQAGNEAAQKVRDLHGQVNAANRNLADAKAKLTTAVLEREGVDEYVKTTKHQADIEADSILADANHRAAEAMKTADREAAKVNEAIEVAQSEHNSFMATARVTEEDLTNRISTLRQHLADIKARL